MTTLVGTSQEADVSNCDAGTPSQSVLKFTLNGYSEDNSVIIVVLTKFWICIKRPVRAHRCPADTNNVYHAILCVDIVTVDITHPCTLFHIKALF